MGVLAAADFQLILALWPSGRTGDTGWILLLLWEKDYHAANNTQLLHQAAHTSEWLKTVYDFDIRLTMNLVESITAVIFKL